MSQNVDGNFKTLEAGEALAAYRLVGNLSSGEVSYCDGGQQPLGSVEEAYADGDHCAVRTLTASGTRKLTAAGAFSAGDILYTADDGKVDDAPNGNPIGIALEASSADGDIVEVLFVPTIVSEGGGNAIEVIGGAGGIAAVDLVYVSDQTDNVMTVLKAQGTSGGRFAEFICPEAIAAAGRGSAMKVFLLAGIDTSAGSVGDPVYLSDSAAGGYTLTKPTATDKVQIVGEIVEDDASTGAILFDLRGAKQIVHDHSSNAEGGAEFGTHKIKNSSNITFSETTGSQIGAAAAQKFGFWAATPVVQPTHNADPAACAALTQDTLTDSTGGAADTTLGAITGGGADAPSNASATELNNNFADIAGQLAKVKADVAAVKAAADANNAAIDAINADFATLGLTAAS